MRGVLIVLAIVISAFVTVGCTGNSTDEQDSEVSDSASGLDAEELYSQITEEDNYSEWSLMPGTGVKDPGQGVHGSMITVYVSEEALSAFENKAESLPDGSILVKEGYNSSGELETIVLMQKRDGYDPEHNDWFWAAYTPDGEVIAEGMVESCQDCHSGASGNDYVFTGELG